MVKEFIAGFAIDDKALRLLILFNRFERAAADNSIGRPRIIAERGEQILYLANANRPRNGGLMGRAA